MIDLIKLFKNRKELLNGSANNNLIEELFIKKYGTKEKAQEAFKNILTSSKAEDNLQELLLKEFNLDTILDVLNSFSQSSNYTETLKSLKKTKTDVLSSLDSDGLETLNNNLNTLQSVSENFAISDKQKDDIITYINQNVNFNLANTRKELGYKHPRIFNPWLNFFFNNKYKSKTEETGKNAGSITLFEYIEIVSAFILSYDEDKLNFSNPDEMLKRIEIQQKTQKQILKELTNNNFSYLKEKLEDLEHSNIYKKKFENKPYDITKRKIPYSLVSIIKEHIKNGYLK
ncbi:hypothetical protein KO494_14845 [Lacinutrix sp. C3R15]|uniref:hypothetical protein n=1 Tax=Flavobacteriaceae TaxID=49546 RepID=UPI001C08CD42|nr:MULTISPECIES: hypothetical protein [Flavobacteriaceae]MBU2940824.1 hypothetical protein [Lacinutrix sp. C3R15]MDO6624142.1 hypothetical protein [Oceanihabitans sp. 1_MG-2023]